MTNENAGMNMVQGEARRAVRGSLRRKAIAGLMCASLVLPSTACFADGFKIPGTSFTIPNPFPKGATTGDSFIIAGVCAVVGTGAAFAGKKLAERDVKRLHLSGKEAKNRELSYMAGFALLGCALGGAATSSVITNMTESAKKAQEDAWKQAQNQTGPVSWSDPNGTTKGTTEIVEKETQADGSECGRRRDVIEAAEGKAEPSIAVCRKVGSRSWDPTVNLG